MQAHPEFPDGGFQYREHCFTVPYLLLFLPTKWDTKPSLLGIYGDEVNP